MCGMEVLPPDVAVVAFRSTNNGIRQFQTSMTTSSSSPEFSAFQKLLRQVYRDPTISLQQVERLRAHLHRLFILRTIDNTTFLLKCSPARDTRLLRHEYKSLETEARVLDLISSKTHVPVPRRLTLDSSSSNTIRTAYLLRSYITGSTLSDILPFLSASERADIDRSVGAYFHSLTEIQLRSFGSTSKVYENQGSDTWSQAFRMMLESALRDAEDLLISLPYDTIRYWAAAHKGVLDEVAEPRMVPMDAGKPSKIVLDERRKHVVGLLGFSNVVWGDPLLAGVFASASEAFWEGYGGQPTDNRGYRIRRLLYYVYRSVVSVATQYYRPSTEEEDFEARRTLTWALGQLAGQ
ncbi:uncharacterized protein PV09_07627 [Verruconis gallopava]|uniref:Aminoglycoside phosphotransferase domain-containing protein n=1 Tax=Verruconis gallopava TaxID=253628 RepID=A0A0D1XF86_9PEZI|nr:uncharacterized protein PV09_07627 [Verruconis gallopava]KIW00871.1 hypothetical protein PV09_07627 [Verruconis gallopava]